MRDVRSPAFPKKPGDAAERNFHYEGVDFVTLEREISRDYMLPTPQTANEVIGYYRPADRQRPQAAQPVRRAGPQGQGVLRRQSVRWAGGRPGRPRHHRGDEPPARQSTSSASSSPTPCASKIVEEQDARARWTAGAAWRRSSRSRSPIPTSRRDIKLILNYAPCSNKFESAFARFLDSAPDIAAWCKVPDSFRFCHRIHRPERQSALLLSRLRRHRG